MKRRAHQGWGEVFKDMKAAGLVTDKNLGEVVKSWEQRHSEMVRLDRAKTEKMDRADKPEKPEKIDKPEKPTRH